MKYRIGDLVRYKYDQSAMPIGVVLNNNREGGTLKVIDMSGDVRWFVTSYCEIVR